MDFVISFLSSAWPYAVALVAFLFLIVVHEFGHFIAAKTLGVKVNEFSVGFGPQIFRKKGKETEYSLRLVPLGGFCAMEGEDEESTDQRAFCKKAAWRRFLIVVMGATFNIIFGIILVAFTLIPQKSFLTPTVAGFRDTAVSNSAGALEIDDIIVEVEGRNIFTVNDLSYNFTAVDDGKLDMTVLREGKRVNLKDVPFKTEVYEGYNIVTVDFYVKERSKTVGTFISQTFKTSYSYAQVVVYSLVDMVRGKYHISDISGPVGVTDAIGQAVKSSLPDLLAILAMISINLGIMNLLPIPALDGGRLVFILLEMIFRRPVAKRWEKWVHAIGLAVLLLFMVAITFKDIWVRIF